MWRLGFREELWFKACGQPQEGRYLACLRTTLLKMEDTSELHYYSSSPRMSYCLVGNMGIQSLL